MKIISLKYLEENFDEIVDRAQSGESFLLDINFSLKIFDKAKGIDGELVFPKSNVDIILSLLSCNFFIK